MSRFRKKPVVIEAVRFVDNASAEEIMRWAGGMVQVSIDPATGLAHGISIDTLEGVMRADLGDWIIKGVGGEFYPCKPAIFKATYEPVS
jgi:hypothetical protein